MNDTNQAKNTKVPVIASFSTGGKMIPLYFRYNDQQIEVGRIIACDKSPAWMKYHCETITDNLRINYLLIYSIREQYWLFEQQSS